MASPGPGPGSPHPPLAPGLQQGMVSPSRKRAFLRIALFILIVALGNWLTQWFVDRLDFSITPGTEPMVHRIIVLSMAAYTLLMAVPFVPGVEIGLAVLMILGPKISGLVYLCTLASLVLSFMIGRFIPERVLIHFLHDLHLHRAGHLLSELKGLEPEHRLDLMIARSPRRLLPILLHHRYLALLVAVNLPGNIVIGGGGGIALIAGLSRLFKPAAFIMTMAVAIAPVPLAWYFFGVHFSRLPF